MGGIEKSVIKTARTKWIDPNKCHEICFVHWSGKVLESMIIRKENVIVTFHHNNSYTIVLCYVIIMIIKIYSIIPYTYLLAGL